uniref:Uncharacterized protein n=1 Tax=Noctiluca scintillans TaxID=2966 RepID=A0A6T8X8C1_NOCSC
MAALVSGIPRATPAHSRAPSPHPVDQLFDTVSTMLGNLFGDAGKPAPRAFNSRRSPNPSFMGDLDVTWQSSAMPRIHTFSKDDAVTREASLGQQSTATGSSDDARKSYVPDMDDLLDQHVAYHLKHHPEVSPHRITRKAAGLYDCDGREIVVEWQYATQPGGHGTLVVQDGPLRQPFADYMAMTEKNAEWHDPEMPVNPSYLHRTPMERRLTFGDIENCCNRLDAMKIAKEQANFREQAADLVTQGREVPPELMQQYERRLDQKLGKSKNRQSSAPPSRAAQVASVKGTAGPPRPPGASGFQGNSSGYGGGPGRPGASPGRVSAHGGYSSQPMTQRPSHGGSMARGCQVPPPRGTDGRVVPGSPPMPMGWGNAPCPSGPRALSPACGQTMQRRPSRHGTGPGTCTSMRPRAASPQPQWNPRRASTGW